MIYFVILITLAALAVLYDVLNLREGRTFGYWGAYIILVCLAGFRFKVGGDTYNYMATYDLLPNLNNLLTSDVGFEKLQPLWLFFVAISKSVGEDFYILQLLHALLINFVIFQFIRINSSYRFTAVLLYYLSAFPYFNFEVLRESLAVCCFLVSVKYYLKGNWLRYYAVIMAAFLFHLSAIILFFLPALKNVRIGAPILALIFVGSALLNPLLVNILSSSLLVDVIGFVTGVYLEYRYTILGAISVFVFHLLVPFSLVRAIEAQSPEKFGYIELARAWLVIAALIPLFYIFHRFFNYFIVIFIIIAAEVGVGFIKQRRYRRIKLVTVPLLFAFSLVFTSWSYFKNTSDIVASSRWYNRWYPYHSIFDPVIDPKRDHMVESERSGGR